MKRTVFCLLTLFIASMALTGCGSSPKTRAGEWEATSSLGEFSFDVSPEGVHIIGLVFDLKCPDGRGSSGILIPMGVGGDIKDGKFSIGEPDLDTLVIEGQFSADNTKSSGSVQLSDCKAQWSAVKVD